MRGYWAGSSPVEPARQAADRARRVLHGQAGLALEARPLGGRRLRSGAREPALGNRLWGAGAWGEDVSGDRLVGRRGGWKTWRVKTWRSPMPESSALLLFSGGQDSTVCLAWALERYAHVETIGFAYGQRHAVEWRSARSSARAQRGLPCLAIPARRGPSLELATLGEISETALTREAAFADDRSGAAQHLRARPQLDVFTLAAALGYRRGIRTLVGGMCETDYSGYPDCRNDTLQALAKAISLGMDAPFPIETPLMWIDKAATWRMAARAGRAAPGRPHHRAHAHVLYCGPHDTARLGLRLRQLSGLCASGQKDGKNGTERQDLIRAVELAIAGDWEAAHRIVQQDESRSDRVLAPRRAAQDRRRCRQRALLVRPRRPVL